MDTDRIIAQSSKNANPFMKNKLTLISLYVVQYGMQGC